MNLLDQQQQVKERILPSTFHDAIFDLLDEREYLTAYQFISTGLSMGLLPPIDVHTKLIELLMNARTSSEASLLYAILMHIFHKCSPNQHILVWRPNQREQDSWIWFNNILEKIASSKVDQEVTNCTLILKYLNAIFTENIELNKTRPSTQTILYQLISHATSKPIDCQFTIINHVFTTLETRSTQHPAVVVMFQLMNLMLRVFSSSNCLEQLNPLIAEEFNKLSDDNRRILFLNHLTTFEMKIEFINYYLKHHFQTKRSKVCSQSQLDTTISSFGNNDNNNNNNDGDDDARYVSYFEQFAKVFLVKRPFTKWNAKKTKRTKSALLLVVLLFHLFQTIVLQFTSSRQRSDITSLLNNILSKEVKEQIVLNFRKFEEDITSLTTNQRMTSDELTTLNYYIQSLRTSLFCLFKST